MWYAETGGDTMKRLTALLIIWALLTSSVPVFAKSNDVKVKIAPFYTEIQSMSVDNRYVEFPLITYKDITYFPMTFSLCRSLGLVSGFDSEKGLFITREEVGFYEETPNYFGGDAINYYDTSYAASIPTYPIYLNGIYIDNTKEEYPLLNFRGITYFPMTWCFAYEELNFDVEWSEKTIPSGSETTEKALRPMPTVQRATLLSCKNKYRDIRKASTKTVIHVTLFRFSTTPTTILIHPTKRYIAAKIPNKA